MDLEESATGRALFQRRVKSKSKVRLWVPGKSLKPTTAIFCDVQKHQLGFHVSIAGSIDLAVDRALEMGCTTFQIFTRNPRGWKFSALREEEATLFIEKRRRAGFPKVVAHMPYLPNLATPVSTFLKKSRASLKEEVRRCDALEIDYLVVHLGSHMGKGSMVGVRNVVEACNEALSTSGGATAILLENMAGQKNSVGTRFEELAQILGAIKKRERAGVCFDTCHAYAAGFDLSSKGGVEHSMRLFEDLVGLDEIKVIHLNDSKGPLGSNLDRHEHIGLGHIGEKGFRSFFHYGGIASRTIIMETPLDGERENLADLQTAKKLIA
jgi:deoxyribonuclease-4